MIVNSFFFAAPYFLFPQDHDADIIAFGALHRWRRASARMVHDHAREEVEAQRRRCVRRRAFSRQRTSIAQRFFLRSIFEWLADGVSHLCLSGDPPCGERMTCTWKICLYV